MRYDYRLRLGLRFALWHSRRRLGLRLLCCPRPAPFSKGRAAMSKQLTLSQEIQARSARPCVYLYRAAASHVRAFLTKNTPEREAQLLFNDRITEVVLRSVSQPATTTDSTWASALARQAIDDSIQAATSLSAAAELINRGRRVTLDGIAQLNVPSRVVNAAAAGQWISEGNPKPVRILTTTQGAVLRPRKLVVIVIFTEEMAASSNIEAVSRALLTEASGLALDAAIFSASADDGAHPAGILNGIAPLTPTAGGGMTAMVGDIKQLFAALAAAGGGFAPIFVASPQLAASMKTMVGPKFDYPIYASASLSAGNTVVLVEPTSFCSGFDSVPQFETSKVGVFHMEDTTPANITGGVPSPAVPVKSSWQIDSVALKMTLRASFGMRSPHVAVVNGATW